VIATTETVVVANKTTRLALTTAQVQRGDYAIQTDSGEKFILSGNNPQQEGHRILVADTTPDWSQIDNKPSAFTPATHTHTKEQVGLGKVDNTSDAEKNSAVATLTNKTINGDNNTITKVNSLKNLKDNSELKLWAGNTAYIPAPEAQQAGVIYFGFKA
jgi:putative membrane-anchored cell surface protein